MALAFGQHYWRGSHPPQALSPTSLAGAVLTASQSMTSACSLSSQPVSDANPLETVDRPLGSQHAWQDCRVLCLAEQLPFLAVEKPQLFCGFS